MQKFNARNTYTPTNISHVCSNCDQVLKGPREKTSVLDLKTASNNPDATLTATGHAGQNTVSVVYVLNKDGNPLMPCKPQKARKLLKNKKAKIVQKSPFTIQLTYKTPTRVQKINLGVDVGYTHLALSAITSQKELYAAEVHLREDIVKLNSERRMYRRSRRSRKTWYRKPRFLNRKKPKGWLAPSIQHKLDSHLKIVGKIKKILPISHIIIEVASFDIQKIKNPDIQKEEYQKGNLLNFYNTREYVLHRDNHTCRHCKGKSKDKILNVHHIISRKIGSNREDNLITLCKTCHSKYHLGKIKLSIKPTRNFKPETFMSTIRWKLVNFLQRKGNLVSCTYGYKTKQKRILYGIKKSHLKDAFIITGGKTQNRHIPLFIKQIRRSNRKLFKGIRSPIRNTSSRFIKGFQRYDKVLYKDVECFIFGRRKTGYFDLRKLNGVKIHSSAKAKDCILLETSRTFLTQRRVDISSNV